MIKNFKQIIESNNNCLVCKGTGLLNEVRCHTCQGTGVCIGDINIWPITENEKTYNRFVDKINN